MTFNQSADILLAGSSIADRDLKYPLVSIIVVNLNYAAYIAKTIQSIRDQDYPWFECVIVDNASTDDSLSVIETNIAEDPRFSLRQMAENLGQLRAASAILPHLRGEFVVSVDADDFLFSNFLSSHVQVHLALPQSVGFSSSNVVEIDTERRLLTGGWSGFAANCETGQQNLKAITEAPRLTTISETDYATLSEATVIVPHWKTEWVWAAGTSNVFRRSALAIAAPDASKISGHAGWDSYFCTIIHLMTGSVLIQQPLSAYRYHGSNAFGMSPRMNAVRTSRSFSERRSAVHRLHVLRTFLSQPDKFNWILAGDRFWPTVDLLAGFEGMSLHDYFGSKEVQDIFAENMGKLVETFGESSVFINLRERMDWRSTWRLARKASGERRLISLSLTLLKLELRRALVRAGVF
jgi:glycosyltransferase involved in cell wall biosynthesis